MLPINCWLISLIDIKCIYTASFMYKNYKRKSELFRFLICRWISRWYIAGWPAKPSPSTTNFKISDFTQDQVLSSTMPSFVCRNPLQNYWPYCHQVQNRCKSTSDDKRFKIQNKEVTAFKSIAAYNLLISVHRKCACLSSDSRHYVVRVLGLITHWLKKITAYIYRVVINTIHESL